MRNHDPIVLPMEDNLHHPHGAAHPTQANAHTCETAGHAWQPTIILGYFQCSRCSKLAACVACVSKVRGKALLGYCQAHRQLRTRETELEVLG